MQARLIIGVMSGTSADGADAALVSITGTGEKMSANLMGFVSCDYSIDLRHRIQQIRQTGHTTLSEIAQITHDISQIYAQSIQQLLDVQKINPKQITAAAVHGQTMFHHPPMTMQWIDPALIAHRTGLDIIHDFRRADCAAGGQGAPLVPFADYILFKHPTRHRALLNIGGIANITLLPAGMGSQHVIGFDTGPGNCISDHLMQDTTGVDMGGAIALIGNVVQPVANAFLVNDYFNKPAPKSTDGPMMIAYFNSARKAVPSATLPDLLATASSLTSITIARSIQHTTHWQPHDFDLFVAGGGIHNAAIMQHLREQLPEVNVRHTSDLGIPTQAREAAAFAILGAATLDRIPANLPIVTGACSGVVLGAVTPAPQKIS